MLTNGDRQMRVSFVEQQMNNESGDFDIPTADVLFETRLMSNVSNNPRVRDEWALEYFARAGMFRKFVLTATSLFAPMIALAEHTLDEVHSQLVAIFASKYKHPNTDEHDFKERHGVHGVKIVQKVKDTGDAEEPQLPFYEVQPDATRATHAATLEWGEHAERGTKILKDARWLVGLSEDAEKGILN